jgi:hypothetical protein
MFRCDNCGSGYSTEAAASWTSCPRCLAKDKVQVPLTFELGWKRAGERPDKADEAIVFRSGATPTAVS